MVQITYCKLLKQSNGRSSQDGKNTVAMSQPGAKRLIEGCPTDATGDGEALQPDEDSILQLLYSHSEYSDGSVKMPSRVSDKGSFPQCVRVLIPGVPAYGIIDVAADVTSAFLRSFKYGTS